MDQYAVNKTMDRNDLQLPACRAVIEDLFALMRRMNRAGVSYSSWYGTLDSWPSTWEWVNRGDDYEPLPGNPDEVRVPWFLLWEIAWLVANTPLKPASRVLDMGGAASLFSCYLASRGHDVVTIDLNDCLVAQSGRIAQVMNWRLSALLMDMQALQFPDEHFDHVFSVCVFEHLPVAGRVECCSRIGRILRPGGTAGFTFDYANPQSFGRLDSPQDVVDQLVTPSGLVPRGRMPFVDVGQRQLDSPSYFGFGRTMRLAARSRAWLRGDIDRRRYSDRDRRYTFGAIFMEKPASDAPPGSYKPESEHAEFR